jgi:hypothetical protein
VGLTPFYPKPHGPSILSIPQPHFSLLTRSPLPWVNMTWSWHVAPAWIAKHVGPANEHEWGHAECGVCVLVGRQPQPGRVASGTQVPQDIDVEPAGERSISRATFWRRPWHRQVYAPCCMKTREARVPVCSLNCSKWRLTEFISVAPTLTSS